MDVAIVIPARYGSRRLPAKPLAKVAGRSVLQRVFGIAKAVNHISGVWVATDDQRIADHATEIGAAALMTPADCPTGTDRVRATLDLMPHRPGAIINLQGDAILTPPWVIQSLVDAFHTDTHLPMVTAAVRCDWVQLRELEAHKAKSPASGTMVTMDRFGRALYFSKNIIPFLRDRDESKPPPPIFRHIGIYGYSAKTLEQLAALEPTPLEKAEQLEQLRALENGIAIKVEIVDYKGRTHGSVDSPDDIAFAETIIAREGELVT